METRCFYFICKHVDGFPVYQQKMQLSSHLLFLLDGCFLLRRGSRCVDIFDFRFCTFSFSQIFLLWLLLFLISIPQKYGAMKVRSLQQSSENKRYKPADDSATSTLCAVVSLRDERFKYMKKIKTITARNKGTAHHSIATPLCFF